MRNSTKKITAIAAALLLSVSGVATTAAMAAPSVFAATAVDTSSTTSTFEYNENKAATIKTEANASGALTVKLYTKSGEEYAAVADVATTATYDFGTAIKPLDDSVTYYIRVYNDADSSNAVNGEEKFAYVPVKLSYTNNVNVASDASKAEIVATIVGTASNDLGDTTVTTITGTQKIGEFTVQAYDLTNSEVYLDTVEHTWDGEGITINQDDFKLYTE
jgi:hypothetical protein